VIQFKHSKRKYWQRRREHKKREIGTRLARENCVKLTGESIAGDSISSMPGVFLKSFN